MPVSMRPTVLSGPMWLRGKARHEAGYIILEEPKEYSLYDNTETVFDLADIEDVNGCVAFADRYGLLTHGSLDDELREPVTEWLQHAKMMWTVLRLSWHYRQACNGSEESLQTLTDVASPQLVRPAFENEATNTFEMMAQTNIAIAAYINQGMDGTQQRISADAEWDDPIEGGFRFIIAPPTLLALAYQQLGTLLMRGVEMRRCLHCDSIFVPVDSRQRYCSPECSGRARYKRFAARKRERESAGAVDAGTAEP